MSTRLADMRRQREDINIKIASILATPDDQNRKELSQAQAGEVCRLRFQLDELLPQISEIESKNTLATQFEKYGPGMFMDIGKRPSREQRKAEGAFTIPGAPDASLAEQLLEDLSCFYRGMEITATDSPLIIGSGGLSGAVPTQVLASLPTYFLLDPFSLAGATVYPTDNTDPLVKPIVSAGVAPDAVSETQSATDSHPMQVDTFTFRGQKYSRLVKATEEALMNSSLDLPNEITGELTAAVANAFTATITAAMVTALQGNSTCLVDSGSSDPYYSILALIDAVPPRFAGPNNVFMGSRSMRTTLRNARASTSGVPLLDPTDDSILGHRYIVNDNLSRLVYGDFSSGVFIRKSPFFLQILLEAFTANGERGFKATQWLDQHFLAEKTAVTTQPLYYTHLDVAGS